MITSRPAGATSTFRVKLRKGKQSLSAKKEADRIPRVARLLALAHKIDGMIRSGELKDWAEAARLIGVTRARMTQIGNLMLLAPEFQEIVLGLVPVSQTEEPFTEHHVRIIVANSDWHEQRCTCSSTNS